ncbi:MAG: condensation domain-containing protein, partial [Pseudonocardiaceae bacterium]
MKPGGPETVVELSSMQKGILFHSVYAADSPVYQVQSAFTIEGHIDLPAFGRAWQRVVDRHQALRCSFFWEGISTPVQAVHPHVDFAVRYVDYRALDPAERERRLGDLLTEDYRRPFDLLQPPQMRVTLIRVGDAQHELAWTRHHIILDGWSQALLLQEVFWLYEVNQLGEAETFDELSALGPPTGLAPYIQWLCEQAKTDLDRFWRPYLQ